MRQVVTLLLLGGLTAATCFSISPMLPVGRSVTASDKAMADNLRSTLPLRSANNRVMTPVGGLRMAGTATLARPEVLQEAIRDFLGEDCKATCTPTGEVVIH